MSVEMTQKHLLDIGVTILVKLLKVFSLILTALYFLFIYWIVIYIALDAASFELSRHNINFASAKVVYDMFLLSIAVSLVLAEVVVGVNLWLWFQQKKSIVE